MLILSSHEEEACKYGLMHCQGSYRWMSCRQVNFSCSVEACKHVHVKLWNVKMVIYRQAVDQLI